jgi:mannose-1-phosphate guanylyltransferase
VILGRHVGLDTRNSLVHSSHRLVATVGVKDLIVVETEDAILICAADQAQRVRELVDRLEEEGCKDWL